MLMGNLSRDNSSVSQLTCQNFIRNSSANKRVLLRTNRNRVSNSHVLYRHGHKLRCPNLLREQTFERFVEAANAVQRQSSIIRACCTLHWCELR